MKFVEALQVAARALAANKLRSVLTMLGIIIGVGAVIALMSIGAGVQKYVTDQFAGLGANLLILIPGQLSSVQQGRPGSGLELLNMSDAQAISDPLNVPNVVAVAPFFARTGTASRGDKTISVDINATTPEYTTVRNWSATEGSFFTQEDVDTRARVAVLGTEAYKKLFAPGEYPVDQTITINNVIFSVIGVMEAKGSAGPSGSQDQSVFVPLSTAQDRLFGSKTVGGDYNVSTIYASVDTAANMPIAQQDIASVMRDRRNIRYLDSDNFSVISQNDVLGVLDGVLGALTLFLGAIAGISLLVGGIGIMNIMLVSVTERTREIGLRKAVGAKRRDVLTQFLVEAVALSVLGGIIGILIGVGGAYAVSQISTSFSAVISTSAIMLALIFSMAVGLFFGIYPAYRASRLNPIDALRYE